VNIGEVWVNIAGDLDFLYWWEPLDGLHYLLTCLHDPRESTVIRFHLFGRISADHTILRLCHYFVTSLYPSFNPQNITWDREPSSVSNMIYKMHWNCYDG
jgi:hypothetical protein